MQNNQILKNLVAFSIIPGLGCRRVKQLILECDDLENVFKFSKTKLRSYEGLGEASALAILSFKDWDKVDQILKQTTKIGAKIITLADDNYPRLLKEIYDPPIILWLKGNPDVLSMPGIGVIGTRNASTYGKKIAKKLSTELAEHGLCIFSGLAYGIDTIAHKAALDAKGATVAVLGSGIDNLYPKSNKTIANHIVKEGGAVISEFPLGTPPDKGNFPLRNRVVSGLSLGVLVAESGIKGGSMITAELALDQNREVFAVPHSLENASGTGCNYLIKRGAAKLVQVVDDILVELPIELNTEDKTVTPIVTEEAKSWRDADLDEMSTKICEILEAKAYQIDDLAEEMNVNTSQLLVALLQLEMEDLVVQKVGKIFELR